MIKNGSSNRAETVLSEPVAVTSSSSQEHAFASLSASLAEVRKLKGVTGYIMRGNASAVLDLAEHDKISQYAFLTHQLHESCQEIAKQLSVAEVENAVVEGKTQKVLFMKIGENKISVFMEKDIDHLGIIKRILV